MLRKTLSDQGKTPACPSLCVDTGARGEVRISGEVFLSKKVRWEARQLWISSLYPTNSSDSVPGQVPVPPACPLAPVLCVNDWFPLVFLTG